MEREYWELTNINICNKMGASSTVILRRISTFLVVTLLQSLQKCHALSASDCLSSFCKLQLSKDLTLQYKINIPEDYDPTNTEDECKTCKIEGQLSYDGYAWLGIGLSQNGEMEGSHAIIGQPNIKAPKSYYLADMDINA